MKAHYFNQDRADDDDHELGMAMMQGYVPKTCLLNGVVVMAEVAGGRKPCWRCNGPRARCHGAEKRKENEEGSQ